VINQLCCHLEIEPRALRRWTREFGERKGARELRVGALELVGQQIHPSQMQFAPQQ